ncbi:MAG: type II/IV secretion system protein [Chloroflexi bacterium]|nr:type II/IV secretion system protein [Chloroflexota bacterium]
MGATDPRTEDGIHFDLNTYQVQPKALNLVPMAIAQKYNVIPLAIVDGVLQIGMADSRNLLALQELAAVSKMRIEPITVPASQIRQAIDHNYRAYGEIQKQFASVAPPNASTTAPLAEDVSDAPVVRALDLIISEAVKSRSSDIHIEPQRDRLRVRYRIDGMLHETMSLPLTAHAPLLSRIKVMSNMDIADHRPQDGQFTIRVRNQDVDIRVATINTIYGEMGSLRILDKSFAARDLSELGFTGDTLEQYHEMLKSPFGMILVTGPTGSGKTTTLYASINSLDRKGRKVVTIEDPVEYRFPDINQIQVNPRAGITFANGLRSIMRHDPDVIMIGEIRDPDTAEIATQAALVGRLVLSSVHANDSVGALFRILDLGIGPFLISATLRCVVSQRMARRVCPRCRELAAAPLEAQVAYSKEMGEEVTQFYHGRGCNLCANTGYFGRTVISEMMIMNEELRAALLSGGDADELRRLARKSGMVTMWRDGMIKVKAGITTPAEILRSILYTG